MCVCVDHEQTERKDREAKKEVRRREREKTGMGELQNKEGGQDCGRESAYVGHESGARNHQRKGEKETKERRLSIVRG